MSPQPVTNTPIHPDSLLASLFLKQGHGVLRCSKYAKKMRPLSYLILTTLAAEAIFHNDDEFNWTPTYKLASLCFCSTTRIRQVLPQLLTWGFIKSRHSDSSMGSEYLLNREFFESQLDFDPNFDARLAEALAPEEPSVLAAGAK